MLDRQEAKGDKRVWTMGEETAKTIDEIDWDRTVAKQLERMQIDLETNLEKDAELQRTIEDWPQDLRFSN